MTAAALALGLYLFGIATRPLLYAGFAVQAAYLLYRGFGMSRIPLVGVHDTLNFLSASTVAFALAVHQGKKQGKRFFLMLSVTVALLTACSLLQQPYDRPLPPVLNTYWFELHVALSFFSYALFAVASMLGIVYLSEGDASAERLQYKAAFIGYSLFSLSMIFGGIWAHLAWGTYWLWTPKELWTTMVWLFYGFYLHARLTQRWAGKPSALMCTAGFAIVMFTYLGVGLLMKSSHSF